MIFARIRTNARRIVVRNPRKLTIRLRSVPGRKLATPTTSRLVRPMKAARRVPK